MFRDFLWLPWKTRDSSKTKKQNELNDLRKIICLRKSEVSIEKNTVCKVTENQAEHGIHSLPCSYISNVINMLP